MGRHRKRVLAAAGVLILLAAAAGFWKWQAYQNRTLNIILIQKAIDDTDFWTSIYQGGVMAARELEVNLTVVGPEYESDIEGQQQMILDAIQEKPDAIALTPSSFEDTVPYAKQIEEAGIKLVLVDSTMAEGMGESLIATDNYEAGYKLGTYMKQFVKEDSVIGIVGHVKDTSTATEREAGVRAGLGTARDKIAEVVFCDSSEEKAYELTCNLLDTYPDMDLIIGLNEYSAVGAARAVVERGAEDACHMAGFDSSQEEISLLEAGTFEAIVVQKPFNMGYLGIETAVRAAWGEKVENYIDSGSELITRDNMYTEENQKLLFPFFGSN